MRLVNSHEHDRRNDDGAGGHGLMPPLTLLDSQSTSDEREGRSNDGGVPGDEFPSFVYASVLAAFGWIMLASWLAFARDEDAALALGMAVVLAVVFFALPIIIRHVALAFSQPNPRTPRDFLAAPLETATGPLSGADAWLQVLIIPLALALAATLIGAAYVLVH